MKQDSVRVPFSLSDLPYLSCKWIYIYIYMCVIVSLLLFWTFMKQFTTVNKTAV